MNILLLTALLATQSDPAGGPPPATAPISVAIDPSANVVSLDGPSRMVNVINPVEIINSCASPVCAVDGGEPLAINFRFSNFSQVPVYTVPAGKTLIIKHVSGNASITNEKQRFNGFVATSLFTGVPNYFVWTRTGEGVDIIGDFSSWAMSQPVHLVARAGTRITFLSSGARFGNLGINGDVTISGTLVLD